MTTHENIPPAVPPVGPSALDKRPYTPGWVAWATYLGGPIAGCYLLAQNDKALGAEERSAQLIGVGVVFTIAVGAALALAPEEQLDMIPNSFIPMLYTLAVYFYAETYQKEGITNLIANGAIKQSGWKATGLGLLMMVPTLILLAIGMFGTIAMVGA